MPTRFLLPLAALAALTLSGLAGAEERAMEPAPEQQVEEPPVEMEDGWVVFRDPLTNAVLDLPRDETPAVEAFHRTGENPYSGDADAVAEGRALYNRWCQACHLPVGTGRIGPSLVDDRWRYPRAATDVGRFEVIHAGGAGAMQAFGDRLSQDDILRTMAYVDTLRAQARR